MTRYATAGYCCEPILVYDWPFDLDCETIAAWDRIALRSSSLARLELIDIPAWWNALRGEMSHRYLEFLHVVLTIYGFDR